MKRLGAVLWAVSLLAGPATAQTIELRAEPEISDTGHYRLAWTAPEDGAEVTLEESATPDFQAARTLYRGADEATVVSGRLDGVYHYRVRVEGGEWSEPVTVIVRHRSLAQAFAFLGVGAVVFLATATLIVTGHRRHRREMGDAGGER